MISANPRTSLHKMRKVQCFIQPVHGVRVRGAGHEQRGAREEEPARLRYHGGDK